MSRPILMASVLALVFTTHAYAGDSVEKLAAGTALGEVSDSPGVVLVDLYADW
ncbi:MAG: hypothetical protein V3T14_11045 [Myxococcota bacterium]